MLVCIFLGFTSGMPLYVLIQLVPAWLRSHNVDLATIGLFSLMSLPYTWKFLWSPLMDRFSLPFLGRRRSWALITQIALFVAIGLLGQFDPAQSLTAIVAVVFTVSLFSASQDIVIDAYRRELLADDELGTGTSFFVNAYRLASLVPGSLALILRDLVQDSGRFVLPRDGEVFGGLSAGCGEQDIPRSSVRVVPLPVDPAAPLEVGNEAAHGALLEVDAEGQLSLSQRVRFA